MVGAQGSSWQRFSPVARALENPAATSHIKFSVQKQPLYSEQFILWGLQKGPADKEVKPIIKNHLP